MNPIAILVIGVVLLIAMILVLRLNAFVALITSAIVVSLLSPGEFADKVTRRGAGIRLGRREYRHCNRPGRNYRQVHDGQRSSRPDCEVFS